MKHTSYLHTQTILSALQFTLQRGGFPNDSIQKKTAEHLIKLLQSTRSVGGRHAQVMSMLEKGATIEDLIRVSKASRRTVFRYLNHIEEAGHQLLLDNGVYRVELHGARGGAGRTATKASKKRK